MPTLDEITAFVASQGASKGLVATDTNKHYLKAQQGQVVYDITPANAGRVSQFSGDRVEQGQSYSLPTEDCEMAIVPLAGSARMSAGDVTNAKPGVVTFSELAVDPATPRFQECWHRSPGFLREGMAAKRADFLNLMRTGLHLLPAI